MSIFRKNIEKQVKDYSPIKYGDFVKYICCQLKLGDSFTWLYINKSVLTGIPYEKKYIFLAMMIQQLILDKQIQTFEIPKSRLVKNSGKN
jgi:hypothetical protein